MAPLRRAYLLVGALLSVALYLVAFPSHTSRVLSTLTTKQQFDGGGHHVVLTTYPRWHEEVWLCLGGMLSDLGVPTSTYTECEGSASCIRYGLLDVAEKIGVWRAPKKKEAVFDAINDPLPGGKYVDTVVLATEKDDMVWASDRLLALWNARPHDAKFRVVGVYHEPTGELEETARQWGPTGSLSFLTLSPHVAEHLKRRLYLMTATADPWSRVDHIAVRTVIPWLPAAEAGLGTPRAGDVPRSQHRRPARVSINGMISPERRAYWRVFDDLLAFFNEDSELWGYTFNNVSNKYEAIDPADPETFKITVLGERDARYDDLPDPGALADVVEFRGGYGQEELYDYMASTDMLLLAWNGGYRYIDSQASSSAFTTLETEVPLLVTPHIARSYPFLDPSIAIVRPHAITEMDAAMLFRKFPDTQGKPLRELEKLTAPLFAPPWHASVHKEAAVMLQQGWRRSQEAWKRKKAQLRSENARVWREILEEPIE